MSSITPQLLAEIPLFSHMDEQEPTELRSLMMERIYQPEQVAMRAGDLRATFQIICRSVNDTASGSRRN
jgi:hypothetical protein